ncbi:hypothetical protein AMAG_20202 [Allomyces macrogynus ATCC 38327]|uniref:Uncharacterized protein n=1 Tax=Allomyces macrogynus (strain ATCC 38327) TaxID=578462 RepID=A0A0L0T810_ALLM3|nr:hypothetical protein AMAG_20202 [Allomyces macrogynus ATCC 38327]|eukprot:KNE70887.1 hypothetical protein AMAG_20202 [Allomyces macrogynus ATCC 38327]
MLEDAHLFSPVVMAHYLDEPSASRTLYDLAQQRRLRKPVAAALNHVALVVPKHIPLRTCLGGLARAVGAESGDAALPA